MIKQLLILGLFTGQIAAQAIKNEKKPEPIEAKKPDLPTKAEKPATEQDRKIEILSQEIEKLKAGKDLFPEAKEKGRYGLGPAASKVYEVNQGVSVGGYGEALYQRFGRSDQSGNDSKKNDEFDTLRTVFYFGYKYNDKIVFNSEMEIEHAGRSISTTSSGGTPSHSHGTYKPEVYAEFATLDFLLHPMLNIKAGLMLVPMGIYNEIHEAPTFLATTRPLTEQRVIPSTWRENGAGLFGQIWDIAYKLYGVTSLDAKSSVDGFSSQGLRGGRQSGQKAISNEFSGVLRLDYVGLPGATFGASGFWGKSGQADSDPHETSIADVHADVRFKGLYLRSVAAWTQVTGAAKLASGGIGLADQSYGAYVEIGYDIFRFFDINQELFPHVRVEKIDTQYRVAAGNRFDAQYEQNVLTFGFAYKPIRQISAKVDYSIYSNKADTGVNQLNFALGYLF